MKELKFRPLSNLEKLTLEKLFEIKFTSHEALLKQLPNLMAKQIDENGSLQFQAEDTFLSTIKNGPAIEARYPDTGTNEGNPVQVNVILHVKNGKIFMLEVFKDDSSRVFKPPTFVSRFKLFTRLPT